jgi:hypothetical protein
MKREELNKKLESHLMWLNGDPKGRRAYFYRADLRGADFHEADLKGVDFREACLDTADLTGADLIGANLSGANLAKADFYKADLTRADLSVANLSGANFSWANLFGADLTGTDLTGARLRWIDLRRAILPQGCKYYSDLPKHNIIVIHDFAHIGCYSRQLTDWLVYGPKIGRARGYSEKEIDLYMEILRRAHEARGTE